MAEEVSAVSAAAEMARLASAVLYSAPLADFGSSVHKKQFLRPVLSGEIGALALTEPHAAPTQGPSRLEQDGRAETSSSTERSDSSPMEASQTISSFSLSLTPANLLDSGSALS